MPSGDIRNPSNKLKLKTRPPSRLPLTLKSRLQRCNSKWRKCKPNKFRQLKSWLASLIGLRPERVSVKYLGTPNNLKNRLTESGGQEPSTGSCPQHRRAH